MNFQVLVQINRIWNMSSSGFNNFFNTFRHWFHPPFTACFTPSTRNHTLIKLEIKRFMDVLSWYVSFLFTSDQRYLIAEIQRGFWPLIDTDRKLKIFSYTWGTAQGLIAKCHFFFRPHMSKIHLYNCCIFL